MKFFRSGMLSLAILSYGGAAWAAPPCPPHSGGFELFSARMETKLSGIAKDDMISGMLGSKVDVPLILYGSPAYSQTSTVWIETKAENGGTNYCTGVLVGVHWVLSAAHCMNSDAPVEIGFGPGTNGKGPSGDRVKTRVLNVVFPEGLAANNSSGLAGRDLVLLKIGDIDICPEYKQPSPILRISSILDAQSASFWAVGFGLTEKKEYGEKRMTALSPVTLTCVSSIGRTANCQPFKEFIASDTKGNLNPSIGGDTCEGDSGGPLFMKKNGRMLVAGITSRGLDRFGNPAAQCGYGGIYTYAGANTALEWLKSHVPDLQVVE